MFFQYTYLPDTLANMQTNVLADIVAIVTGTTNVNSLSAGCDKSNSLIVSDVPAGWTLHDAAAGTNARCVKAPIADDPAAFKYVVLDTNSVGNILQKLYYSWDATAHTGKFLAQYSDNGSFNQRVQSAASTVGGMIFGWVSARYMVMLSLISGWWGDQSYNGPTIIAERSRMWQRDTVAAGIPPVFHGGLGYILTQSQKFYAPLKQDRTGALSSGTSATLDMYVGIWGMLNGSLNLKGQYKKILNADGQSAVPIFPLYMADAAESGMPYGSISDASGIFAVPGGILGQLEVVTYNGLPYMNVSVRNSDDLGLLMRRG